MMDKATILKDAREQIANGNMEHALESTTDFLAGKPSYKRLYNEALLLSSMFSKTKLDQAARTISFENAELNYGKVRQGLFNLLDLIEKDDLNPQGLLSGAPGWTQTVQNNKWLFFIGLPLLVLTLAVFMLVKKLGNKEAVAETPDQSVCRVSFRDSLSKNFLIIPFFKPTKAEYEPEGLVIDRLSEFCSQIESFKNAEFEICKSFVPDRTLSFEEGAKKGLENKATIVIWGLVDKEGATKVIKTRYKYLGNKDIDGKLPFSQMNQSGSFKGEGEQVVVTENVLSIIASTGELTEDLENSLKLLVGMIAHLDGNNDDAITAMHAAQVVDSSANVMKYMVLADNFNAKNEPEKAKVALDTCLNYNDKYWLGRNNRANLRIQAGDYLGAIEDLNVALSKRPDDADMLLSRGVAYRKSEQLYAAKQDFEKVLQLKPEKAAILRPTLKETSTEIRRLEKIVEPTKTRMKTSKVSKQDVVLAAAASNKLGNTRTTRELVAKGLEMDQNNPELIAIQVDNLLKAKEPAKAKAILKAAVNRKVKPAAIAKQNKNVAILIREMTKNQEL